METAAYYLALVMVVATPAATLIWFLIHPFARQWRKIRPFATYLIVGSVAFVIMVGIYRLRAPLLEIHFGVSPPLVVLAAFLSGVSIYIGIRRWRQLKPSTLLGLPEISPSKEPGELVTEGIYSQVRHPRYLEFGFGLAGIALFSNYLAIYLLLVAYIPVIYLVVILEERELKSRFGPAYEDYCEKVPRFVPRFRGGRRVQSNNS